MASENELQIVLTLIDNASAELKKITNDVKKDTQEISKESEKAGKSLGDSMKDARKQIIDFRRQLFAAALVITTMYLAVKEYAKYNKEANLELQLLEKNLTLAKVAMGGFIFLLWEAIKPSEIFYKNLETIRDRFLEVNDLGRAKLHPLSLGGDFEETMGKAEQIISATQEMKNFKQELSDANLLYLTGRISAEEYYNVISSNQALEMSNRQMMIGIKQAEANQDNANAIAEYQNIMMIYNLRQQLATQQSLMRSQQMLEETTNTQASMNLLKTLQSYHHTAWSSMMDFSNMVIQKFSTGMTTALTSIIMGTQKAKEAFKEFGIAMITAIVEFVIQYGIQMLIWALMSKLIIGWTITQAEALAAAWLPAAVFASVATLGAAGAAGAAGLGVAAATALGIMGLSKLTPGQQAGMEADIAGEKAVGYQSGGWVGLRGPEVALVGERGPEYVVPNNRLGNMGNQTSIYIEINNPQVRSDEDIDKLTEEISLRLAREAERL